MRSFVRAAPLFALLLLPCLLLVPVLAEAACGFDRCEPAHGTTATLSQGKASDAVLDYAVPASERVHVQSPYRAAAIAAASFSTLPDEPQSARSPLRI
ncbi:MAG: hypothetical protein Q7W30_07130 [Coriobacteriia bacterium]|nr:hypothetical protein [Coriobacteriia bacterium]